MKTTRSLIFFTVLAVGALLSSGCRTRTIVPEEVLQLPTHAAVYTAYNLWYENPEELTTDNIQKGSLIPFGTEVKLLSMTDSEIVFRAEGKTFTLKYDEARTMMPIEDFAKQLFTTSVAVETAAGVSPASFEKMRRGIIEKGMTKQNVITTYGPPSKIRTPNQLSDSWIYWVDRVKSKRVIFRNGKVMTEIVLE